MAGANESTTTQGEAVDPASALLGAWVALKPSDKPKQGYYWWRNSMRGKDCPVIHFIWNDFAGIRSTSTWHSPEQGCLCGEWWGPLSTPNASDQATASK